MIANSKQKLSQWRVIDILSTVIALTIFYLILINANSNILASLGFKTRTGFAEFIPVFVLSLYISFRLPNSIGRFFSITFTFIFFGLALAELWKTGQSQSTVFNGIIPLFDASSYYTDALRLTIGQNFSSFSARRPLFPGLFAVLLSITDRNLMVSLALLTTITAGACYLTVLEIKRTHGAEAAVFVLLILFLFYRFHIGLVMSESLGVALGALGFALVWRGFHKSSLFTTCLGIFVFTLALIARAGTFFVLPLLVLYRAWVFRKSGSWLSWQFLVGGMVAIVAGFLLNWLMFRLLAIPSGIMFANFSYSLYGLASGGKHWSYIFETHPEILKLQEPYQSGMIYKLAFEQIRNNPGLLFQGMLYNWSNFLSVEGYGAFSFAGGSNTTINFIVQCGLYVLSAFGIYRWFRNRSSDNVLSGLVIMSALGILLSVPFLPPTDASRVRPYASSIIIFALLPTMGLMFFLDMIGSKTNITSKPDSDILSSEITSWYSLALIAIIAVGPYIVKSMGKPPQIQSSTCSAGETSIVARFDPGTYFNITPDSSTTQDGMPNFHLTTYKRNSHDLANQYLIDWAVKVTPPTSIFYAFDYRTNNNAIIQSPDDFIAKPGNLLEICGYSETSPNLTDYNIFYAQSINVISQ